MKSTVELHSYTMNIKKLPVQYLMSLTTSVKVAQSYDKNIVQELS